MEELPIVYCRGYSGPTSQINGTVNDPFYGFNEGATHTRVDGDGDPRFYQFEGPLLRLLGEHDYKVFVRGSQAELLANASAGKLDPKSIWVDRFYDEVATTFTPPPSRTGGLFSRAIEWTEEAIKEHVTANGFNIEQAATELYDLIIRVLDKTGAPKVNLVAHSMGGLVARCMMQKICETDIVAPDGTTIERRRAKQIVARLFTYATPHGGIRFSQPVLNWAMEMFGPAGSDIFSPPKMYGYLTKGKTFGVDTPPAGGEWDPRVIPSDIFDVDDVFCLIGTDQNDYNLAKLLVGPRSDGLVDIENAYVKGAHRAFVYKSHSGPYGEVNSEEGYQNLARFLFGDWSVYAGITGLTASGDLDDPADPRPDGRAGGGGKTVAWQADLQLAVRGLSVLMTEQKAAHYCPILLTREIKEAEQKADKANKEAARAGRTGGETVVPTVPLLGTFLFTREPADADLPPTNVTRGVGDDSAPAPVAEARTDQGPSGEATPVRPSALAAFEREVREGFGEVREDIERLIHPPTRTQSPAPSADGQEVPLQSVDLAPVIDSARLSRYAFTLRVYQVATNADGTFDFSTNLEQVGDWQDVLIVDIGKAADGTPGVWTGWNSDIGAVNDVDRMPNQMPLTNPPAPAAPKNQNPDDVAVIEKFVQVGEVDVPASAKKLALFGPNAKLTFRVVRRTTPPEAQLPPAQNARAIG